jgi:hypothetical protein
MSKNVKETSKHFKDGDMRIDRMAENRITNIILEAMTIEVIIF